MRRATFSLSLTISILAGCEVPATPGEGAAVMVPGRAYDVTHSAGYGGRLRFTEDGKVQVWQDGAWLADGQTWFRRNGKLCLQGAYGGPDFATCARETPAGTGGFSLAADGNRLTFSAISG